MAIKSAPYYWLECDGCGEHAEYGDYTAMSDEVGAVDAAYAWTQKDGKHHCESCPSLEDDL